MSAATAADVSHWFAAAMWRIELDGEVVETIHKLVGRRGRLLAPVTGYDEAMHELRELTTWRARDRAVTALTDEARAELADRFASARILTDLMTLGEECDDGFAGRAGALAADCAYFAIEGVHAQAPFVGA